MLIAIAGLPGVGKTTVARAVSARLPAAHLRIDALEAALLRGRLVPGRAERDGHGYDLALAVADTCLAAGTDVVVDAVFPVAASRAPFDELGRDRRGMSLGGSGDGRLRTRRPPRAPGGAAPSARAARPPPRRPRAAG